MNTERAVGLTATVDTDRGSVLLVQFAREPRSGHVKTRMMPYLSAAAACELHCELTRWTCRALLDSDLGDVELSAAGNVRHPLFSECVQSGVKRVVRQVGADLGQRMYNALRCGLARYTNVILVGSDCPGIDASYLRQAIAALQRCPIVLGPAADGGYVLIGARKITGDIFRDIAWGSDDVYAKTCAALRRAGLTWEELPVQIDIDRPTDLPVWESLKSAANHK